jgi:hypothetical protein
MVATQRRLRKRRNPLYPPSKTRGIAPDILLTRREYRPVTIRLRFGTTNQGQALKIIPELATLMNQGFYIYKACTFDAAGRPNKKGQLSYNESQPVFSGGRNRTVDNVVMSHAPFLLATPRYVKMKRTHVLFFCPSAGLATEGSGKHEPLSQSPVRNQHDSPRIILHPEIKVNYFLKKMIKQIQCRVFSEKLK